MKLAFYVNYLNHHQVAVADELYRLLGDDFTFVATYPYNVAELKGGEDYSKRPYCLQAAEGAEAHRKAMKLLHEVDVAVIGGGNLAYEIARAKTGKLTFEMSERWLKRGWLNVLSPLVLKNLYYYYTLFKHNNIYKLCCGGYAASDCRKLGVYKDRCFKWGYFTGANATFCLSDSTNTDNGAATIMWCARFIQLKHPELPVKMATRFKNEGYRFILHMYGDGIELQHTQALALQYGVEDVVRFMGNISNTELLHAMGEHEILIFTSNRLEGWGAVVNEAMANGCVPVVSDAVGCAPYLIKDGVNGLLFKSGDVDSLTDKMRWLLEHPEERRKMREAALHHINSLWSPRHAAEALLQLSSDLLSGKEPSITEGPGSRA